MPVTRASLDPSSISVDLSRCRYDVVHFVVTRMMGFHAVRTPDSTASSTLLVWSDVSIAPNRIHQLGTRKCLCNHFPNIEQLCRKLPMSKLLLRMQASFPEHYDFFPVTFASYSEYNQFVASDYYRSAKERGQVPQYYICKPNGGCQGKNIFLTDRVTPHVFEGCQKSSSSVFNGTPAAVANANGQSYVVQEYLDRPLKVLNRKNDLRCYVLVSSFLPLTVYFYSEGIVRICRDEYEHPTRENADNVQMHLANYAVNKVNRGAHRSEGAAPGEVDMKRDFSGGQVEDTGDVKWSFAQYTKYITQQVQRNSSLMARARTAWVPPPECGENSSLPMGPPPLVLLATNLVDQLWQDIHMLCLKSVLAAQHVILPHMRFAETSMSEALPPPVQLANAKPHVSPCFELLGFDVMVDEDLKPWLIEINHSPSWFTDSNFDFELKRRVIRDALQLTMLPHVKKHHSRSASFVSCKHRSASDEGVMADRVYYAQELEEEGNGFVLLLPKRSTYEALRPVFDFQGTSRN